MNRSIIIMAFAILLPAKMLSQEFYGTAVYESLPIRNMEDEEKYRGDERMKKVMEKVNKLLEKTYALNFNKYESIYEEEQQLEAPSAGDEMQITMSGGTGKTYKNIKDKVQITEEDLGGKDFLVTDSLKTWKWELKEETKRIGNYTCYKAINIDRVTAEDLKRYEDSKKKQEKATASFFGTDKPEDSMTTVWYTLDIPVSQGPQDLWGLPGLILEVNFNNAMIVRCTKIVLNPKTKTEIKKPKKGKKVTKKEYESLSEKHEKQMEDIWSRERRDREH
ncbi:MAG TPA: GLPGLI family protein [Flavobacterium sp.]|nr:GLPGLI family protein [Flavobacterium sp.]